MEVINGTSLDDFLDHTDNAELRQHLQHCSIDTEGWDPLVLEGFHKTLAARRVPTVAFEYIARGYWRHPMMRLSPRSRAARTPACGEGGQFPPMEQRRLGEVLERLTSFGYACFFQVAGGGLVPASVPCWHPRYANVGWANLLCAHEPRVVRLFRRLQPSPAVLVQSGIHRFPKGKGGSSLQEGLG